METVTTRELTCIGCPMGCPLTVTMEAGEVISVTGIPVNVETSMQEKK